MLYGAGSLFLIVALVAITRQSFRLLTSSLTALSTALLAIVIRWGTRSAGGTSGEVGAGILVGRSAIGDGGGVVEGVEALLCFRQVPVVESVRVHLHEKHHSMQKEEDLGGPSPLKVKRYSNPEG